MSQCSIRTCNLDAQLNFLFYVWGGRSFPNNADEFESLKQKYSEDSRVNSCDSLLPHAKQAALSNAVRVRIVRAIDSNDWDAENYGPHKDNSDWQNPERQVFLSKYYKMLSNSQPLVRLMKGEVLDARTFEKAKSHLWCSHFYPGW